MREGERLVEKRERGKEIIDKNGNKRERINEIRRREKLSEMRGRER